MSEEKERKKQGFATLTPERRKAIASSGGRVAHMLGRAHRFTTEEAKIAGRLGGKKLAENLEHMREIGRTAARRRAERKEAEENQPFKVVG